MRLSQSRIFLHVPIFLSFLLALSACEKGCDARFASPQSSSKIKTDQEHRDTRYYETVLKKDWEVLKTKIKEEWDRVDDYDLSQIQGSWEKLSTTLQAKYQKSKEEADAWIKEFMTRNKAE